MDLDNLFGPEPLVIELRAQNCWEAIDELVGALVVARKIQTKDRDSVARNVRRRESAMSTAIGFGFAVPHASTGLVAEVMGAIGVSRRGIDFKAPDGKPVDLVLLYLVPQGDFQKHLHTLANIATLLHRRDFRDRLRQRFF